MEINGIGLSQNLGDTFKCLIHSVSDRGGSPTNGPGAN